MLETSRQQGRANTLLHPKALLSRDDLKQLGIKVSNSSLLRWEQHGRFPRRIRMAGTTVAWLKAEVDAWLEARAEERCRHVYADF